MKLEILSTDLETRQRDWGQQHKQTCFVLETGDKHAPQAKINLPKDRQGMAYPPGIYEFTYRPDINSFNDLVPVPDLQPVSPEASKPKAVNG